MKKDDEYIRNLMNEIAHQWRQPLSHINSIVSSIDNTLYENNIQNNEIEEKLKEIEKITKYMSRTINDLNDKSLNQKNTFLLEDIFDEILTLTQSRLDEHNIKFLVEVDKGIYLNSNNRTLLQAMTNIVNNSIDALLERNIFNAYIKIDVLSNDKEILLRIMDNGGGISQSAMEKMFDKSYTTKHASEGSGIGLYMTKEMIETYLQASLSVYNKEYGVCFEIKFNKDTFYAI